ncbi:MAG: phosphatase PAP2 family protein [Eubacteriales bacterium]|nr:phosphatase PAP2 family protein [Eubacteriales bacterium]
MDRQEGTEITKSMNASFRKRWILAGILLAGFIIDACWVMTGGSAAFDDKVRLFMYSIRTPLGNAVFPVITQMASSRWIIGWIAVLLIIPKTRKRIGLPQGISQLATFILYKVLKAAFARPRPDSSMWLLTEHGFSFPSGHSMNGCFFYFFLIFLIRKNVANHRIKNTLTVIFSCMPFIVAFTRLYIGVHYVTDVCGGLMMGGCCVMICTILLDRLLQSRRNQSCSEGVRE